MKIKLLWIISFLAISNTSCADYIRVGKSRIYKYHIDELPKYSARTPLQFRAEFSDTDHVYGQPIKIRVTYFNTSQDTLLILPKCRCRLMKLSLEDYPNSNTIIISDTLDIREITVLPSNGSTQNYYQLEKYEKYLNVKGESNLILVCTNTIYRIDDDPFVAGIFESDTLSIKFHNH